MTLADFTEEEIAALRGRDGEKGEKADKEREFTAMVERLKSTITTVCMMYADERTPVDDLVQESLINLIMVFYSNRSGDVLVKFVHSGRETRIPALSPYEGPYYRWDDVRSWFLGRVQ